MDNMDTLVERIFQELKEKGLIDMDTKLVVNREVGNSRADVKRKIIEYNPEFFAYLDDDAIRFALLHEMGHIAKKTRRWSVWIGMMIATVLILILLVVAYYVKLIGLMVFWHSAIFICVALAVIFLAGRLWVQKDEYDADKWASLKMHTHNLDPVKSISSFFKSVEHYRRQKGIKNTFLNWLLDVHPSDNKRIKKVKDLVGGARNA